MYLDNSFDENLNTDMENLQLNGEESSPSSAFLSPNSDSGTSISSPTTVSPISPVSPTKSPKKKLDKRTSFNRFLHKKIPSDNANNDANSPLDSPPYNYNIPTYKGLAEIKLDNDNILDSMKEELFFMMSCDEPDSVALRFLRAR